MQNKNGFEIDAYNQYGLKENAKYSICPLCSEHRKKKDDKCAQLFWDIGLGNCYHCGERFQLHTYKKREKERNIEWRKPLMKKINPFSINLLNYFKDRGISKETLDYSKVSEGLEYMPQVQKEVNTIRFNYFRDGELINVKYRDARKNFKLEKDAELIFYNLDSIKMCDSVVIVEGEMDALSYIEAGIYNVVSVPNGATLKSINLEYLDNCIEYFENKSKIYLALDKDDAGKNLSKELSRRLIGKTCYLVDFKDKKDANEYLCAYGKESLFNTINEAKDIPIEGTSSLNDWKHELDNYLLNGALGGHKTGIQSFDNIFSTYTGQYLVVTGIPSCFTKEQLVHTSLGVKQISELEIGDKVLSYNHKERKNEYKKVIDSSKNTNKQGKLLKIKMKDGSEIKVTEDHRFFTGTEYLQIKDILLSLQDKKL